MITLSHVRFRKSHGLVVESFTLDWVVNGLFEVVFFELRRQRRPFKFLMVVGTLMGKGEFLATIEGRLDHKEARRFCLPSTLKSSDSFCERWSSSGWREWWRDPMEGWWHKGLCLRWYEQFRKCLWCWLPLDQRIPGGRSPAGNATKSLNSESKRRNGESD